MKSLILGHLTKFSESMDLAFLDFSDPWIPSDNIFQICGYFSYTISVPRISDIKKHNPVSPGTKVTSNGTQSLTE